MYHNPKCIFAKIRMMMAVNDGTWKLDTCYIHKTELAKYSITGFVVFVCRGVAANHHLLSMQIETFGRGNVARPAFIRCVY